MQRANFDKIFFDISAALGKAENKHPIFCKNIERCSFITEKAWKDKENLFKEINDRSKSPLGIHILMEEVAELGSAYCARDLEAAYSEAADVAVVAVRIMEFILTEMGK